jgi:hypothetical protein
MAIRDSFCVSLHTLLMDINWDLFASLRQAMGQAASSRTCKQVCDAQAKAAILCT